MQSGLGRRFYTGIGSTKTPKELEDVFGYLATFLEAHGWILRSGGAPQADTYFENGVTFAHNAEIYLPWKRFNNNPSELYKPTKAAYQLAEKFHPNWAALSEAGKALHARNSHQIIGQHGKILSEFVIAWTKDGKMVGGTSQALRIAKHFEIPIFNFGDPGKTHRERIEEIKEFIKKFQS
jgi:hypothetical protein